MSLVKVRDLELRYGSETVLSGVNLDIHPGEIVTIVGPRSNRCPSFQIAEPRPPAMSSLSSTVTR